MLMSTLSLCDLCENSISLARETYRSLITNSLAIESKSLKIKRIFRRAGAKNRVSLSTSSLHRQKNSEVKREREKRERERERANNNELVLIEFNQQIVLNVNLVRDDL
jgi:hypothetical protein